jgi:hypothetical protein
MAENPSNTIALPGVDFNELAKQAISAHIVKGMASSPELITQIVAGALTRKVDNEGKVNSYSHHNTHSFLQFVTEDLIRKAALEALQQHVDSMKPDIVKAVTAQLKKAVPAIALALVDGFAQNAKDRYRMNVAVKLEVTRSDR